MKLTRRLLIKLSLVSILLIAALACQVTGNPFTDQSNGDDLLGEALPEIPQEPPIQETQPPDEPAAIEPAPTEPAPEQPQPTQPPQPAPTEPQLSPPSIQPPQVIQQPLIVFVQKNAVPILIGLGILLLGIALIVAVVVRPRPSTPPPPYSAPPVEQPQSQVQQPSTPVSTPEPSEQLSVYTHLQNANPEVVSLYQRFANMVEKQGPVSIVPTKTRIDFQVRIIFASVQLYLDSLQINLLLPRKIEHPRVQRVDVFGDGKYLHYITIRSLDDYDAQFTTWLQDSYRLGAQG